MNKFYAKTKEGKPAKSREDLCCLVEHHSRDAGKMAAFFLQNFKGEKVSEFLPNKDLFPFLVSLHDIGKANELFQNRLRGKENEYNHAHAGQWLLEKLLSNNGSCEGYKFLWPWLIGAHHGKWDHINVYGRFTRKEFDFPEEVIEIINFLSKEFGKNLNDLKREGIPDFSELHFATGLTVLCDWLVSNFDFFEYNDHELNDDDAQKSVENVKNELPSLFRKNVVSNLDFSKLFSIPGAIPNELQNACSEIIKKPGIFIIEQEMGGGKTEAALYAAKNLMERFHTGIYFGLPTQLTSNKIYERFLQFIQQLHALPNKEEAEKFLKLVHSNANFVVSESNKDDSNKNTIQDWFGSNKEKMLSRYGVGTIDQALLLCVPVKHFFLRAFALANKVIILDEIHSYDTYTSAIIQKFIQEMRDLGSSVIILSATLRNEAKKELFRSFKDEESPDDSSLSRCDRTLFPCITYRYYDEKEIRFKNLKPNPEKIYNLKYDSVENLRIQAIERFKKGETVLWIRNTVSKAQEDYIFFKDSIFTSEEAFDNEQEKCIGLLHSRFRQCDRNKNENLWTRKLGKETSENSTRAPCILVATQVAEQSLDIDCDTLFTEHAPTDFILQRIGRCRRHLRQNRCKNAASLGEVFIFLDGDSENRFGNSEKVYSPYILECSHRTLKVLNKISIPHDIKPLLESTYNNNDQDEEINDLRQVFEKEKKALSNKAEAAMDFKYNFQESDEDKAKVRLVTTPNIEIILLENAPEITQQKSIPFNFDKLKSLKELSIRVPFYFTKIGKDKYLKTSTRYSEFCRNDFKIFEKEEWENFLEYSEMSGLKRKSKKDKEEDFEDGEY